MPMIYADDKRHFVKLIRIFLDGEDVTSRVTKAMLPSQPSMAAEGLIDLYVLDSDGRPRVTTDIDGISDPIIQSYTGQISWTIDL